MIAVTGAAFILTMFLAFSEGTSRALAFWLRRRTNPAGEQFMLVGPAMVILKIS